DAQPGERLGRLRRRAEEERLAEGRPALAAVGDAALEVQQEQVRLAHDVADLLGEEAARPHTADLLGHVAAQHRVAGERQRHLRHTSIITRTEPWNDHGPVVISTFPGEFTWENGNDHGSVVISAKGRAVGFACVSSILGGWLRPAAPAFPAVASDPRERRALTVETALVLAGTLGYSAYMSLVSLLDAYLRPEPLSEQSRALNAPQAEQSFLDLLAQL